MSVKCGSCKGRHERALDVRDCYAMASQDAAEARAEAEMEKRSERWWEERGGAADDPRERELWAMEDLARETAEIQRREREDDLRAYASKPDYQDREPDLMDALRDANRAVQYGEEAEAEQAQRVLDGLVGASGRDMASPAQVRYVMDLLAGHVWPDDLSRSDVENMERRQVSKLIDAIKRAPIKANPAKAVLTADAWKHIPAGRYALYSPSHENGARQGYWKFFEVGKPTEGTWAGRVFVSQLFGSPGDYRKEPRRGNAGRVILEAIGIDPEQAMADFGKQSGTCGKCRSPLTNEESLARGIGPVCLRKMGW